MIIFDSNVWIALFYPEDSQHAKAQKIFQVFSSEQIIVPECTFLEVVTVLRLRTDDDVAQKFSTYALSNSDIEILWSDKKLFNVTVDIFAQYQKIAFTDASLVVLSQEYEVVTFDRILARTIQQHNK